jgi:hypothetical protein
MPKKTKPTSIQTHKLGPGEYLPSPTLAIKRAEDLPKPINVAESRNYDQQPCPKCKQMASRRQVKHRTLHDIGDLVSGRRRELKVSYSQHYCRACHKHFGVDLTDLAPPKGRYTNRVVVMAVQGVQRTHGSGGRTAIPRSELPNVARSTGFCAFCYHPELGGSRGEKGPKRASRRSMRTGP